MDGQLKADVIAAHKLDESPAQMIRANRHLALLLLCAMVSSLIIAGLVRTHLWIENGKSKDPIMTILFLPGVELYLMLLSSILLCRIKPRLAAFDCCWYKRRRSEILGVFLLIFAKLLIMALGGGLRMLLHLRDKPSVLLYGHYGLSLVLWAHVHSILLVPIAEEAFWRGYVQSTLAKTLNPWIAVIGQAVIFGMVHPVDIVGKLQLCVIGLTYGIWCHKRKTLLPLIIVHSANNLVVAAIDGFKIL